MVVDFRGNCFVHLRVLHLLADSASVVNEHNSNSFELFAKSDYQSIAHEISFSIAHNFPFRNDRLRFAREKIGTRIGRANPGTHQHPW